MNFKGRQRIRCSKSRILLILGVLAEIKVESLFFSPVFDYVKEILDHFYYFNGVVVHSLTKELLWKHQEIAETLVTTHAWAL